LGNNARPRSISASRGDPDLFQVTAEDNGHEDMVSHCRG